MTYNLRNLPPEAWASAKARAEREGVTMRQVILAMVELYVSGHVTVHPPQASTLMTKTVAQARGDA